MSTPIPLAIFASGTGTNFRAIMEAATRGELGAAEPVCLVVNKQCPAIAIAEEYQLPVLDYSPELELPENVLIALAGFMKILPASFVHRFENRILNLHPSILPAYPGLNSIARAFADGVDSGCTVHLVDEGMDTGPILAQSHIQYNPQESLAEFEQRIHAAEHQLFPEIIRNYSLQLQKQEGTK